MSAEGRQNNFIRLGEAIDPSLLRRAGAIPPAPESADAPSRRADSEFYSELNLNRFPFASLFDKDTGRPGAIVVRQKIRAGRTDSLFEWIVSPGEGVPSGDGARKGGLPGPFDRRVFRAIEKIVMGRTIMKGEPLTNPQALEVKEVLETLRLTVQTHNYRSVARALGRLQGTQISCSGIVKSKSGGPAKGVTFSPLSEIRWAGEADPETGLRIDRTRIYFAPVYLESVNSFNVRPIDWDLWLALNERPLAQRLYEILEMGFFGLKDSPYKHFSYSELCQLLPTRPQAKKSDAMRVLDRAHEALKEVDVKRRDGGCGTVRMPRFGITRTASTWRGCAAASRRSSIPGRWSWRRSSTTWTAWPSTSWWWGGSTGSTSRQLGRRCGRTAGWPIPAATSRPRSRRS
jgi:hypothetical protein